jgi:hypothetical protein
MPAHAAEMIAARSPSLVNGLSKLDEYLPRRRAARSPSSHRAGGAADGSVCALTGPMIANTRVSKSCAELTTPASRARRSKPICGRLSSPLPQSRHHGVPRGHVPHACRPASVPDLAFDPRGAAPLWRGRTGRAEQPVHPGGDSGEVRMLQCRAVCHPLHGPYGVSRASSEC